MNNNVPITKKVPLLVVGSIVCLVIAAIFLVVALTRPAKVITETSDLPTVAKVSVTAQGFSPQTTSIKSGSAVEFTNTDTAPHWVESDPYPAATSLPGLNARAAIGPGESFTTVITTTGTFTYHDQLSPTITGTLIVE